MQPSAPISQSEIVRRIAERVNVSPSTVSRVLSGEIKGKYPKIARRNERILAIADEYNYRPTFRGRIFQGGRTNQIALLYSEHDPMLRGVYAEAVHEAVDWLADRGYFLFPMRLTAADLDRSDLFLDKRFDACIVHHFLTPTLWEAVQRAELPCVLLNAESAHRLPAVLPDERQGTLQLAEHLIGLGHRHITYAVDERALNEASVKVRRRTLAQCLPAAGVHYTEIFYPDLQPGRAVEMWSACGEARSTAIIVQRLREAVPMLVEAKRAGIKVPADVSVATFDDGSIAELAGLTTVATPFAGMGIAVAKMVVAQLDGDSVPLKTVLPERLVVRSSTAEPRPAPP